MTGPVLVDHKADLSACDREPIHVPGSIQPHGVLLALDPGDLRVAHASANLAERFGVTAQEAVGQVLEVVLPAVAPPILGHLRSLPADEQVLHLGSVALATLQGEQSFELVIHRSGPVIVIELEDVAGDESLDALYPTLRSFVEQLQIASTSGELYALAAQDIRRLTDFDRVLVYRFDEDWNGTVVAEDRNDELPSYLDLRFPASDIPRQARELYRRNRLRIIPDATYEPVRIHPSLGEFGQPLDLSQSILRSVSPVHLEYMRNMETLSSMSISIIRDGALWGLISCHNRTARRVSLSVRNACDFLAQILALQLAARERAADAETRMRLGSIQARLLGHMAEEERFIEGLLKHPDALMSLAGAGGAAILSGDQCWLMGATPGEPEVRALFEWLSAHHREDVFATDALAASYPEAQAYMDRAAGLLAISISKVHASYILWFRPEVIETVRWGGDPNKPVEQTGPSARLHPRRSFETWKETVRGRSLPWQASEIDAVKELRNAVVGIVLRRAEELASLSEELQRSNKELEAFSYSVSHDLRAPFRHIVGYSELLRRQEGDRLTERGRRFVDTIIDSAISAGTLVDNLLSFSQMGRTSLKPRAIDMQRLVSEVQARVSLDAKDRRILWRVHPLPTVTADPMLLRLVLENLLSNAVKYTRGRDEALIEIGARQEPDETVFYVRDNGIGFDMAYVGKLFGVFQRLHRMEEFEGTGIGLANVRRIVERHGGRTWAEGALDRGATFWFSLPGMTGSRHG